MQNKVLDKGQKVSRNFFSSDLPLQHYLQTRLSARNLAYLSDKLSVLGEQAAAEMNELSLTADKYGPQLKKRNFFGETVDEIIFHPAYRRLTKLRYSLKCSE
jgi:acyl-CoA dehydrogenase